MRFARGQVPSVPLLGVVLWTCMMVLLNGPMLPHLARQFLTVRNIATWGTVVEAGVSKHVDEDGDTVERFWARYRYEVDGRSYEGSKVSHSPYGSYSGKNAWDLRAHFPEGAPVRVYYRSGAPGDAVLLKGPQGADLFFLLFLMPFDLTVPLGWYSVVRSRRQRGVVHSFRARGRTHVPLAGMGLVGATLCAMWFASFVAAFILGMTVGMHVSRSVMLLTWFLVVGFSVAAGLWHRAQQNAGVFDLILDERKERLSVPAMLGRKERLDVRWGHVRSVTAEEHLSQDSEGDVVRSWRPTLTLEDASGLREQVALVDYKERERAELLVDWLRERLRLERRERPEATRAA
jgi:hypothetical protein